MDLKKSLVQFQGWLPKMHRQNEYSRYLSRSCIHLKGIPSGWWTMKKCGRQSKV